MSKSNPKIILNGKTYTAPNPKAKLWREIIKFNKTFAGKDMSKDESALDQVFELISISFKNKEITPELIEEELDLDELMPKFAEICEWVSKLVAGKSSELPNSPTPVGK